MDRSLANIATNARMCSHRGAVRVATAVHWYPPRPPHNGRSCADERTCQVWLSHRVATPKAPFTRPLRKSDDCGKSRDGALRPSDRKLLRRTGFAVADALPPDQGRRLVPGYVSCAAREPNLRATNFATILQCLTASVICCTIAQFHRDIDVNNKIRLNCTNSRDHHPGGVESCVGTRPAARYTNRIDLTHDKSSCV
jgi:hypothetical protein